MRTESELAFTQAISKAIDFLTKFSVPLYVEGPRRRPEQYGTAFFVRANGGTFLVSADHVLRVARTRHVFFYTTQNKVRYLAERVLTTGDNENKRADPLDLAVMRLDGAAIPPFPEIDKFLIDLEYLQASQQPRSGKHYAIIGFPATKSLVDPAKREVIARVYAYRSDSIPDEDYHRYGLDPRTHIVLPFDRKRGFDEAGRRVTFPKPHGMSGSPMVALYGVSETNMTASRVFPVVGVGTRWRAEEKLLIGTDVRFVREMIDQHVRA